MKKTILLFVLALPSSPSWALYECPEHGRLYLSSAPCDTTFVPLSRYFSAPPASVPRQSFGVPADSVTLQLDSRNRYMMDGTVQGVPVSYTVDTGAGTTSISSRVASAAGITTCIGKINAITANGTLPACVAIAPRITFGPFAMNNVQVTVMPDMDLDALLGMDALKHPA